MLSHRLSPLTMMKRITTAATATPTITISSLQRRRHRTRRRRTLLSTRLILSLLTVVVTVSWLYSSYSSVKNTSDRSLTVASPDRLLLRRSEARLAIPKTNTHRNVAVGADRWQERERSAAAIGGNQRVPPPQPPQKKTGDVKAVVKGDAAAAAAAAAAVRGAVRGEGGDERDDKDEDPAHRVLSNIVLKATSVDTSDWPSLSVSTAAGAHKDKILRVYVISLPERADRRLRLASSNAMSELSKLDGMTEIRWWPAVPKKSIPPSLQWLNQNATGGTLLLTDPRLPAQYACLQSHVSLWKYHAQHHPNDDLLILEDDVRLPLNFAENYHNFVHAVPNDWEVLLLGTDTVWNAPIRMTSAFWEGGYMARTTGYVIRANVAQKVVQLAGEVKVRRALDEMLTSWFGHYRKQQLRVINGYAPPVPLLTYSFCDLGSIEAYNDPTSSGSGTGSKSWCPPDGYGETEASFRKRLRLVWFAFCGGQKFDGDHPPSSMKDLMKEGLYERQVVSCEAARCNDELVDPAENFFLFSCAGIRAKEEEEGVDFEALDFREKK